MKRYIIILSICLALVVGIGVAATIFDAGRSNNYGVVYTATASQNKQVQQKLKDLGYYTGAVDGIIGAKSKTAIKAFQKAKGLTADGIVGTKTLAALGLSSSSGASQSKQVQQKLKELGYYTGAVDGIIGAKSKAAIKAFQKAKGLTADGIAGAKTLAALGLSSSSSTTQNSGDLYLLAKCVHAEARGEPYLGQVAVAAVILNRVKSSLFPNSISGVIYQPYAFTCVNDGQINLEPNQSAYNAARDAMNGWDPSYGCLYYYNPVTATSKWIFTRQVTLKIGKHAFAL